MGMDVELTISGLCLVVLESTKGQPAPRNPAAIDVVCPDAHHHRALLSYAPEGVIPTLKTDPDLVVDATGRRIASLPLKNRVIQLKFGRTSETEFIVEWGKADTVPGSQALESWLNWVPRLQEIGLTDFKLGGAGTLPKNAAARLSLPFGTLAARDVVKDLDSGDYAKWNFPAAGVDRAIANQIVYRARGVGYLTMDLGNGEKLEFHRGSGTFQLSLSNDLLNVDKDYNKPDKELKHLAHLQHLDTTQGKFQPPKEVTLQVTGKPICNQVMFVDEK